MKLERYTRSNLMDVDDPSQVETRLYTDTYSYCVVPNEFALLMVQLRGLLQDLAESGQKCTGKAVVVEGLEDHEVGYLFQLLSRCGDFEGRLARLFSNTDI